MPFSWAWEDLTVNDEKRRGTTFWGPFIIFSTAAENNWSSVRPDFSMYVKFKGQK